MTSANELDIISKEIAICERCSLHHSRKLAVPGEGPPNADIILIGEGPGFHENEQGRPFVGASGRYLEKLLASIGLTREDVFIANVVKCRPPSNRDPLPEELMECKGFLDRQIDSINPKVIVTLGRFSMARYFPNAKISHIHGKPRLVYKRLVVPMYHPAAGLRRPSLKQDIEKDFSTLPELIEKKNQIVDVIDKEEPKQLNLF